MLMKNRIKNFQIQTKLGSGSYGIIYKALNKATKQIVVLKQISLNRLNQKAKKSAINQATIMGKLIHPFIVRYQQSFIQDNNLNIVMEYCDNGDLNNFLRLQNKRPLKQQKIWKFFVQICLGLQYIHKNKILHRDIKSLNIFLNKNQEVKIGDLGVAKMLTSNQFAQTMVGTPFYLSPQLCQEKPYNQKSDIWALGCLLYELCTFRHPFQAQNQASLILKIIRGKYAPIPQSYSRNMKQVIDLCLQRDYKRRPTASTLLSRPNIQQVISQLGIPKIIDQYTRKAIKSKQIQSIPKVNQISQIKKIVKAIDNNVDPIVKKQQSKQQLFKRQQAAKQIILNQKKDTNQKKIEQIKKQQKKQLNQNFGKMNDEKDKFEKKLIQQKKVNLIKNQQKKRIEQKVQKKQIDSYRSPSFNQKGKQPTPFDKKYSNNDILKNNLPPQQKIIARPPIPLPPKDKNKQQILKVKNQKIIQPKVYEAPKPIKQPIIKSGGFSMHEQQKIDKIIKQSSKQKQKINDKYRYSNKRHSVNNLKVDQSNDKQQSKILFGPSSNTPNIPHKSQKNIVISPQISHIQIKNQKLKQQVNKISRVRKGGSYDLARNARNASKTMQISKQQQALVMNLPNDDDSSQDQKQISEKLIKDIKNKTNKSKFKLKDIDDELVLQKYEQLMNSQKQIAQQTQNIDNLQQQYANMSKSISLHQNQQKQQKQQQILQQQQQIQDNTGIYNYSQNQLKNNSRQPILEQLQNQSQFKSSKILSQQKIEAPQQTQWQFDEEPQLPMLEQKQNPFFQQNNPYLMQDQQQEPIQNKISFFQTKLSENMKRQNQINKLMQIKIQQCKSVLGSTKLFNQILQFFRNILNMEDEFNSDYEKEIDIFLRKKGLADQRKFQNIYKILHFQMQLENTRKIIQNICKKLGELQQCK